MYIPVRRLVSSTSTYSVYLYFARGRCASFSLGAVPAEVTTRTEGVSSKKHVCMHNTKYEMHIQFATALATAAAVDLGDELRSVL